MEASRFAAGTDVPAERSRLEIERVLTRYGATSFWYGWGKDGAATLGFMAHGRAIQFSLPMPRAADFARTPQGKPRAEKAAAEALAQAVRQRWRALLLVVKAKLEAVASGLAEFETEFLAYIMLPSGGTVGDAVRPQVARAYAGGSGPVLLLEQKPSGGVFPPGPGRERPQNGPGGPGGPEAP